MSKTLRKILHYSYNDNPELIVVDDTQCKWRKQNWTRERKITPYIKDIGHRGKYTRTGFNYDHANTGFGARTGINNANRSMRKGVRQNAKKQIITLLSNGD